MRLKVISVCLFSCLMAPCFISQRAIADELTPAKRSDIQRLMTVTNSAVTAKQFAAASSQQLFKVFKIAKPEISDRTLGIIEQELMGLFSEKISASGGLFDQVIPIYSKYFTHQEIRDLLAFYETPIGKKTISVMPQLINESMISGQKWGDSLGPEIKDRVLAALKREGILSPSR